MITTTTAALFSSQSVNWATPQAFYNELDREFAFDFDPCPLDGFNGGTLFGFDGLYESWKGKRVFCNPPYGPRITDFLLKALQAQIAVFLLPARTDTRWFHEIVLPNAREIRFIRGRLKFGEANNSAPFPSMVVIFRAGDNDYR